MEVAIGGKALRKQFGADDLAIFQNQTAGSLVREHSAGDARNEQRIPDAEEQRRENGEADRGPPNRVRNSCCV